MRQAFVHTAVLAMAPDADDRAPGAAITVALCGAWQHEPPCPLAAHHTAADRVGDELRLRVLFAAEAAYEAQVRDRIDTALTGVHRGPDGVATRWRLLGSGPGTIAAGEAAHAQRLTRG
jgi:hypothetical protein